jgi:hypothetical protein
VKQKQIEWRRARVLELSSEGFSRKRDMLKASARGDLGMDYFITKPFDNKETIF